MFLIVVLLVNVGVHKAKAGEWTSKCPIRRQLKCCSSSLWCRQQIVSSLVWCCRNKFSQNKRDGQRFEKAQSGTGSSLYQWGPCGEGVYFQVLGNSHLRGPALWSASTLPVVKSPCRSHVQVSVVYSIYRRC